jgi:hypothetical protein
LRLADGVDGAAQVAIGEASVRDVELGGGVLATDQADPLQERPRPVHLLGSRRIGIHHRALRIQLRDGFRAAAVGPVGLLEPIRGRQPDRLHLLEERVALLEPGRCLVHERPRVLELPGSQRPAHRIRRPPAAGRGDQLVEGGARLLAGRQQGHIRIGQHLGGERLGQAGPADRLQVVEEGSRGERGGRCRVRVRRGIRLHVGGLVRPDAAGHASEDRAHRIGADRLLQRGDESPGRRVPVRLALRAGVSRPGVQPEGSVRVLRRLLDRVEGQADLELVRDRRGHDAGEALTQPANFDQIWREPDVADLVQRREAWLIEGDRQLRAARRLLPEPGGVGGDGLDQHQLADARVGQPDLRLQQRQCIADQGQRALAPRLVVRERSHAEVGRPAVQRDRGVEARVLGRLHRGDEGKPAGRVLDRAAHQRPAVVGEGVAVDADLVAGRDGDAHLRRGPEAPCREYDDGRADSQLRVVGVRQGVADLDGDRVLVAQVISQGHGRDVHVVLVGDLDVEVPLLVAGGHVGRLVVDRQPQLLEHAEASLRVGRRVREGQLDRHRDPAVRRPHVVGRLALERVLGGQGRAWRDRQQRDGDDR